MPSCSPKRQTGKQTRETDKNRDEACEDNELYAILLELALGAETWEARHALGSVPARGGVIELAEPIWNIFVCELEESDD